VSCRIRQSQLAAIAPRSQSSPSQSSPSQSSPINQVSSTGEGERHEDPDEARAKHAAKDTAKAKGKGKRGQKHKSPAPEADTPEPKAKVARTTQDCRTKTREPFLIPPVQIGFPRQECPRRHYNVGCNQCSSHSRQYRRKPATTHPLVTSEQSLHVEDRLPYLHHEHPVCSCRPSIQSSMN
jgi:hypothetical protein